MRSVVSLSPPFAAAPKPRRVRKPQALAFQRLTETMPDWDARDTLRNAPDAIAIAESRLLRNVAGPVALSAEHAVFLGEAAGYRRVRDYRSSRAMLVLAGMLRKAMPRSRSSGAS
jgi:hypothetical protein